MKLYQIEKNGDRDDKELIPDKTVPGGTFPRVPPLDISDIMPPMGNGGGSGTGGIPKTGVEGALLYWAYGLIFFLLAGGAIWKLSRLDNESKERKRRD